MTIDARKQALPIFTAVVALLGVIVVLQLWLLSASLEGLLTGEGRSRNSGGGRIRCSLPGERRIARLRAPRRSARACLEREARRVARARELATTWTMARAMSGFHGGDHVQSVGSGILDVW